MTRIIKTSEDAIALLHSLSAPPRLIQHHCLVLEAACELVEGLMQSFPQFIFNAQTVFIGVALHDSGKVLHHNEISGSGNQHERGGEQMLLSLGVSPEIARFCRTHAQWKSDDAVVEDWLVALADSLWKGDRNEQLETIIIKAIAQQIDKDYWDIFITVDSLFEAVADRADEQLSRSLV